MAEIIVKADFATYGFKETDLSRSEWRRIREEFLRLYREYCDMVNGPEGYTKINQDFDDCYTNIGNVGRADIAGYLYGSYVAYRINELMYEKMKTGRFQSDILEPFTSMDGNIPDLMVGIKGHEGWEMNLVLIPQ